MAAAIIPLDFEEQAVRVVMQGDAPWFVAADVCRVLQIKNSRDAVSRLDEDEKGVAIADTLGGAQSLNIVSESGLYALIFTSRLPAAKRFRKWVTAEVLPAIRRTGSYAAAALDQDDLAWKRERYWSLHQKSRDDAALRIEAVERVQRLIGEGMKTSQAVRLVAQENGRSVSTIRGYRRTVRMVPTEDWGAALVNGHGPHHGLLRHQNHEAIEFFLDLCKRGFSASDSYRMTSAAAAGRGWPTLPSLRSMQRVVERQRTKARALVQRSEGAA